MPSDFLTPFLELDDEFCKNFRGLDMTEGLPATTHQQRVVGFQRRHSLCPVTLPNSKFNSGSVDPMSEPASWPLNTGTHQWTRGEHQQLPRSTLNHIPFRVDRSVSMIEGHVSSLGSGEQQQQQQLPITPSLVMPPPGLSISTSSLSSSKSLVSTPPISTRYKTELCRTFEENGTCKYGAKCQFAHGMDEMRGLSRHPKYKTEPCRTFHTIGFCPYGARCHFVHEVEGTTGGAPPPQRQKMRERPQLLRQSISFAGFSSPQTLAGFQPVLEPLMFSRASSVSPPPSTGSPELLSPMFPEPGMLQKHAYPFSADLGKDQINSNPQFFTITDSTCQSVCVQKASAQNLHHNAFSFTGMSALQRCASADSLSDQEGYTSSSSMSGCESPNFEGRRLPIFSRLSVSDD